MRIHCNMVGEVEREREKRERERRGRKRRHSLPFMLVLLNHTHTHRHTHTDSERAGFRWMVKVPLWLTLLGGEVDFDGGVAARVVDGASVDLADGHYCECCLFLGFERR